MKIQQINAKLIGCPTDKLKDEKFLIKVVETITSELGLTEIKRMSHFYGPGVSVVFLIAESHISIHTYPEFQFANIEIETCKETSDIEKGLQIAIDHLKPKEVKRDLTEHPLSE